MWDMPHSYVRAHVTPSHSSEEEDVALVVLVLRRSGELGSRPKKMYGVETQKNVPTLEEDEVAKMTHNFSHCNTLQHTATPRNTLQQVNLRTLPNLEKFKSHNITHSLSRCGAILLTDKYGTSPLYKVFMCVCVCLCVCVCVYVCDMTPS